MTTVSITPRRIFEKQAEINGDTMAVAPARPPTRHRLDSQLEAIRQQVMQMMEHTEAMFADAMLTLLHPNGTGERSEAVVRGDDLVDALNLQTEQDCLRLLALQQPVVASDLRFVGATLKIVDDIERIGDHAVNIAKTAERLRRENVEMVTLADLETMREAVGAMLRRTREAFDAPDVLTAQSLIAEDEAIDVQYAEMRRVLQACMQSEPCRAVLASHLLFVAHYLERIGDHCVGIAERILYLKTGMEKEVAAR